MDIDLEAEDVEVKETQESVSLEIPVGKFEYQKKEMLEDLDIDIEEYLSAQLQPSVENILHEMYQEVRYSQ